MEMLKDVSEQNTILTLQEMPHIILNTGVSNTLINYI